MGYFRCHSAAGHHARHGLITREFPAWRLPGSRFHSSKMSGVNPLFVGKAVDLEQRRSNIIMKKTRQTLEVPLKRYSGPVLEARQGAKHGPYVFYNPATGDRFHDVKLGLKSAVKRGGLSGITRHTFRTRSPRGSRATGRTS
jgi:hypothetical protein